MDKALIRRILLAIPAGLLSLPAAAQSLAFGSAVASPYSSSKTEAILGGSSRLSEILAQQSAAIAPAMIPQASVPAPANAGQIVRPAAMPVRAPVSPYRPDVFGSVALSIARTPLDTRWRAVSRNPVKGHAAAYATKVAPLNALAKIDAVNRYVNARVTYINDIRTHGVEDRWASGAETLARGKGDCEDYAIAKLQILRKAGFAEKDLYLVVLRDLQRRADHAVLVVRAEGRLLVLDNGTDRIVDSAMLLDYRPIFSFSGNRVWTHGYRRPEPSIFIASAEKAAANPDVKFAAANAGIGPTAPVIPAPSASN